MKDRYHEVRTLLNRLFVVSTTRDYTQKHVLVSVYFKFKPTYEFLHVVFKTQIKGGIRV